MIKIKEDIIRNIEKIFKNILIDLKLKFKECILDKKKYIITCRYEGEEYDLEFIYEKYDLFLYIIVKKNRYPFEITSLSAFIENDYSLTEETKDLSIEEQLIKYKNLIEKYKKRLTENIRNQKFYNDYIFFLRERMKKYVEE